MDRTPYLHVNGTDYELPSNYSTNSQSLDGLRAQVEAVANGNAQPLDVQILRNGGPATLSIYTSKISTYAVWVGA
jgi:hypothetical protein